MCPWLVLRGARSLKRPSCRVVQQIKTDLKFTDKLRYFDELEKKIKIKFSGVSELDLDLFSQIIVVS